MPAETPDTPDAPDAADTWALGYIWASSGIGPAAQEWRFRKEWSHFEAAVFHQLPFSGLAVLLSFSGWSSGYTPGLHESTRSGHKCSTEHCHQIQPAFGSCLGSNTGEGGSSLGVSNWPRHPRICCSQCSWGPLSGNLAFCMISACMDYQQQSKSGVGCIGIIVTSCGFATWHDSVICIAASKLMVLSLLSCFSVCHGSCSTPSWGTPDTSFVTANKSPWIFPWLIPWARASRLITPWIILCPLSPLLWTHGYYAKIAGAIKCSNLKLVSTQLDHAGNTYLAPFLLMDYLPSVAARSSPPFACIGWCGGSVMEATRVWLCILPHYSSTPLPHCKYIIAEHRKAGGIELEQFLCYSPTRRVIVSPRIISAGSLLTPCVIPWILNCFAAMSMCSLPLCWPSITPWITPWILNLCHGSGALNFADGWLPGPLLLPSLHNCFAQCWRVEAWLLQKVLSTICFEPSSPTYVSMRGSCFLSAWQQPQTMSLWPKTWKSSAL